MKSLFGVAVTADTYRLQNASEKLQVSEDDVAHSLENQVTYIRNLDQATRVNTQMLFNLSTTVKNFMINSHDRFYNFTRDIMWLNVTVYSQSKV